MNRARASAPPTVGNVGVGFDLLGHALAGPGDIVTVTRTDRAEVRVTAIRGIGTPLPTDAHRNTAGRAALALLPLFPAGTGLDVEIDKGIAMGSGMGGSASSAVAAAVAVAALLPARPDMATLFHAAVQGEAAATGSAHGDNVAPALLGGLTIAPHEGEPLRLPVPSWLHAAVVRPHFPLETRRSREVLTAPYAIGDFVRQSEGLALLLAGCHAGDPALIRRGLHDVLVEPRRAPLIPGFAAVKQAALDAGALGASISGGGPSVFAWCADAATATRASRAMQAAFVAAGHASDALVSPVDAPGARVLP
ncbi:MAG: homoserine kinase [Phycisphaerales bacterium]